MKATFEQIIAGRQALPDRAYNDPYWIPETYDRLILADGVSLSVQVSRTHYCAPRTNWGPYYQVEVGYPMAKGEHPIRQEGEPIGPFCKRLAEAIMPMPATWSRYGDGSPAGEDGEYEARPATVWAYVPVELVAQFIADHGGETKSGAER